MPEIIAVLIVVFDAMRDPGPAVEYHIGQALDNTFTASATMEQGWRV